MAVALVLSTFLPSQGRSLSAGSYHTCGIASSTAELRCWGANSDGKNDVPSDVSSWQVPAPLCIPSAEGGTREENAAVPQLGASSATHLRQP